MTHPHERHAKVYDFPPQAQEAGQQPGEQQEVSPMVASVDAYVNRRRQAREIAESTAESKRNILRAFALEMGQRRPENIGRSDIERWMIGHADKAPGTRRARFAIVHSYFDDLVDRDLIRKNPMRQIKAPTVPKSRHRALRRQQVAAILRACPDELAVAYMVVGFQCGFRRAEVVGIQLGDIAWGDPAFGEEATITVTGKGGHVRTVPFPLEAQAAVERYLAVCPCNGGPLFRQRRFPERAITTKWLGRDFALIAYAAGVKQTPRDGVSFHAARHTALTDVYRDCHDVRIVQQIAGHASLKTTQTYIEGSDVTGMAKAMSGRSYLHGLSATA